MSWVKKILPEGIRTEAGAEKRGVPEGVWEKCPSCHSALYKPELETNAYVCPQCQHHLRINARTRLRLFFDENSTTELADTIYPVDALKFVDTKPYSARLLEAQKKTDDADAMVCMEGKVAGVPVVVAAFNFEFLGGSMGSVVGEKFTRAATHALEKKLPFICFTASGGARMQESLFSLMQMAKASAVLAHLKAAAIPYLVVLTDPTTGGVSASLAMLGDIHLAEPKALIGFAGPRVIEQTVREKLPEGFQRSEFLKEKGMLDMIVDRRQMRDTIARLLRKLTKATAAASLAA